MTSNLNLSEGSQFLTGGAILGGGVSQAVGGMGLAGGFGAVSLGAVPVVGAGAIAGAAAYGVFKGISTGDRTAFATTGIGAMGGIGVSATVGGMGLVGGFGGIGIGMGTMAIAGGIVGLGVYGVAKMLDGAESAETPFQAFDRMEKKIDCQDAYLQALADLDPKLAELEWQRKFSQLEVNEELKLLKAKLRQGKNSTLADSNPSVSDSCHADKIPEPSTNAVLKASNAPEDIVWECISTINADRQSIHAIAISPDRKWLAVASANTKLFDLQTGKRSFTFFGQVGGVYGVAIAPNGKTIASGGFDRKLTSWRLDKKHLLHTYLDRALSFKSGSACSHLGAIEAIAYSPDGKIVASASADKTIKIWNIYNGECKTTLAMHEASVLCLAISPDGQFLASGSADNTIGIWSLSGNRRERLKSDCEVRAIAISPDSKVLASGGASGEVTLWDLQSGSAIANLVGCISAIKSLAISSDGKLLACGGLEGKVEIWNLSARKLISTLTGNSPVTFSHDSRNLVTGGRQGQVKIWRAAENSDGLGWVDFTGKQWYEILSVDINANRQEVKRAYIRLARMYHPDVNQSPEAKSQMQAIKLIERMPNSIKLLVNEN